MAEEVFRRKLAAILRVDLERNRCPDITSQLQERVMQWMPLKFPIWTSEVLIFPRGL
jgi:hypothetical protein